MSQAPVAALYVSEVGPYAADPRFDAWGIQRDARAYAGSLPVVGHPPCERWGRFATGGPTAKRAFTKGDDGGCFASCLGNVRRLGGVIEHPQGSYAFQHFGLPTPPRRGWSPPDEHGGRSTYIDQGAYGHPAKKPTWLYAVLPSYPELNWTRVWGLPRIGGDGFHSKLERAKAKARVTPPSKATGFHPNIPDHWRWRTPDSLKDALFAMAASCHGWKPSRLQVQQPLCILDGAA
jgi:hypothetical protein